MGEGPSAQALKLADYCSEGGKSRSSRPLPHRGRFLLALRPLPQVNMARSSLAGRTAWCARRISPPGHVSTALPRRVPLAQNSVSAIFTLCTYVAGSMGYRARHSRGDSNEA